MRALTINELEYVSGGTTYDNPWTGPTSPFGCRDTVNGCGDPFGTGNNFFSLDNDQPIGEVVIIDLDRDGLRYFFGGSKIACEGFITATAAEVVYDGMLALYGAEAIAGLLLEVETAGLSTLYVAEAVANFMATRSSKYLIKGLAAAGAAAVANKFC